MGCARDSTLIAALIAASLAGACGQKSEGEAPAYGDHGPVRGDFDLARVVVSQAVVIPVWRAGTGVVTDDEAPPLIPGRTLWVHAAWSLPDDWRPRRLSARLRLSLPDGQVIELDDRATASGEPLMVAEPSDLEGLGAGFEWQVAPAHVVPGLGYSVAVIEATPGADGHPARAGASAWPAATPTALAVASEGARIELSLVGIRYQVGGCVSDTSSLSGTQLDAIREGVVAWYGIEEGGVTLDTSLVLDVDEPLDIAGLMALGGRVRAQYPDLTRRFFYFMLDDCSPFPVGVQGSGPINAIPPEPSDAPTRYAVGLWHADDLQQSVRTLVHELGHAQGARHAPCGDADAVDPDYPHASGSIGSWGLDPRTGERYDPATYRDYMGYCGRQWVSDYGFRRSYEVLRALGSWPEPDPGSAPARDSL